MLANSLKGVTSADALTPYGEETFLTATTSYWQVPDGVYSICVVCIGAGGGAVSYSSGSCPGGGGGGLAWANDLPVTPGETLTITVGAAGSSIAAASGTAGSGGLSSINNPFKGWNIVAYGGNGGSRTSSASTNGGSGGGYSHTSITTAKGGGNGGSGGGAGGGYRAGGGGAGGYTGNGGNGASTNRSLSGSSGSGGGGGGGGSSYSNTTYVSGGAGGGTHYLGQGVSGSGGFAGTSANGSNGGYGGQGSYNTGTDYAIQLFGYQPGQPVYSFGSGASPGHSTTYIGSLASNGVVRIIWGKGRGFPSTKTGSIGQDCVALANSNYGISVYHVTENGGFIGQAGALADSAIRGSLFSKKSDAIILTKSGVGAFAYRWSIEGFGSNFSNVSFPASSVPAVMSPLGDAIAFPDDSTNRVSIYKWSNQGFGEKYPNLINPPSIPISKIMFSPSGKSILFLLESGNTLFSVKWSSQEGFGSVHSNSINFGNYIVSADFSPDGSKIIVLPYGNYPRVYDWSDEVGFVGSTFKTFGNTTSTQVIFHPKKNYVLLIGSNVDIYNWSPISGVGSLVKSASNFSSNGGIFNDIGNIYAVGNSIQSFSLTNGLLPKGSSPSLGTVYSRSIGRNY